MAFLKKGYSEHSFLADYNLLDVEKRILNAGSSSVRYGENCVNVDIQEKENVDFVCDLHKLPDSIGEFDAIICNAVLQYCHTPVRVAKEFHRILKTGRISICRRPLVTAILSRYS